MGELFADFLSVISEIFSWKSFKINYIFSCSKNVPTRARQIFSIGEIHYKQRRFSKKNSVFSDGKSVNNPGRSSEMRG